MNAFYLIVVDRDQRLFNVVGPMNDDTDHINAVVAAQKKGRDVRCFTPLAGKPREAIVSDFANQTGFAYSDEPVLD